MATAPNHVAMCIPHTYTADAQVVRQALDTLFRLDHPQAGHVGELLRTAKPTPVLARTPKCVSNTLTFRIFER